MNSKVIKKVLALTLAATLLAMPIVAGATDQAEAPTPDVVSATTPVAIGGTVLKSDVAGAVSIPKTAAIAGVVVRQSAAQMKTTAGLAANESAFVRAYEITEKKSPAAYASFKAAAAATGGTVLDAVNIDLGKMAGGKFADLPAGVSVPTTVAVKSAAGRTLAVAKVLPGGATEILQDQDDDPNTVTFPITGGLAAYAVIAY